MDALLQNNHVRIHTTSYINGSYEYSSNLIYDSYPQQQLLGSCGCIGPSGPTGPTGRTGQTDYTGFYEVRRPNKKIHKAYHVEFMPTHNTQESYDEIVCPFLDLDDIRSQLIVYEPNVTKVRLDIKPEFLDEYNQLQEQNKRILVYNNFTQNVFKQIEETTSEEHENIKATATLNLNDELVSHKEELDSIIIRMIEAIRKYNENDSDDDSGYDSDYDYVPHANEYTKSSLYVPS